MDELNEFFKLVGEENKKKREEQELLESQKILNNLDEIVSSIKNPFIGVKIAKKKKIIKESSKYDDIISTLGNPFHSTEFKKNKEIIIDQKVEDIVLENTLKEEILIQENEHDLIEKSLGLLAEPSDKKVQSDPLTPLDQKFATLDDLQKHYKLFLERIQQQLSTIGGGGETRLRYLDDVVGIATNSGAYNKKYLQWNSTTNRAEFTDPSDAETTTIVSVTGITTYYQATNTDDYIGVNANVPVEIRLPTSPIVGKKVTVKDEGNKISLHNITVTVGAGVSVENDTSVVMKINHQSFTYFYNGSNWFLV
jgi:hypothetical protein